MLCFNQFADSSQIYKFRDTESPVKQYFAVICPSVLLSLKSGAPNKCFLLTLKTFFMLPRVFSLERPSKRRYKIGICWIALEALGSFQNYKCFYKYFFPHILDAF